MDPELFATVDDIVRSLTTLDASRLRSRVHRYGIKVWLDADVPTRLHHEAQVLGRRKVDGIDGIAVEIGFHAEKRSEADNESALAVLVAAETTWRKVLGPDASFGEFFDAPRWRRLSDVWIDPDLRGDEVAFEIASRLVDYIDTLEPLLDAAGCDRG